MKIMVASDIHGRITRLREFLHAVDLFAPDKVILLGDFLYNGPRNGVPEDYDPMGCANLLNRYANIIIGIRGNCDSRIDEELLRFPLKDSRQMYLCGYRCDLIHGDLLTSNLVNVSRGDILMFGHTHVPMLKQADGVIYLNPGSISFPKQGSEPSYALMSDTRIQVQNLSTHEPIMALEIGV